MNYVDVCTGIDAATVAWSDLDWQCKAVAEIEPFPCAVLASRFGASRPEFMPQPEDCDSAEDAASKRAAIKAVSKLAVEGLVPNRGDFTTIQGDEYGTIDLLVGGTPCQDFSVAGLRAGMDGKRGQLTVEFAKLAHRLAPKARARWVLWENVPGVLSIDGGEAFATFLGILAKRSVRVPEGGWANSGIIVGGDDSFGLAYRVLDAQHFGVPQRRRRVFVVGYFGDWRRAAAVLFERHSLSGDTPPRREKGQVAPTIPARSLGGSGLGSDFDCDGGVIEANHWPAEVAPTLNAHFGEKQGIEDQHIRGGQVSSSTGEIAHCLNAGGMGRQDFETETLLAVGGFPSSEGDQYKCGSCSHMTMLTAHTTLCPVCGEDGFENVMIRPTIGPFAGAEFRFDEQQYVTHSLRGEGFDASEDGTGRGTPLVPVYCDEVALTLRSGSNSPASHGNKNGTDRETLIAFSSKDHGADAGDISPTLRSMGHDGSHANGGGQVAVAYRTAGDGCVYEEGDQTAPLTAATDPNTNILAFRAAGQDGFIPSDVTPPITSTDGGGAGVPTVMTLAIRGREGEPTLEVREDGIANAVLTPNGGRGGIGVGAVAIQNATRGKDQNGLGITADGSMYTLDQGSQHGVAISLSGRARGDDGRGYERAEHHSVEIAGTLDGVKVDRVFGPSTMAVRRLTPEECEFLQGFSRGFTKISEKTADGPRYKALGNSMAVPVMRWIGERIQMVEDLCK